MSLFTNYQFVNAIKTNSPNSKFVFHAQSTIPKLIRNYSQSNNNHVVIIGSGWGAYRALREINQSKYKITIVSPKDYFVFTPFLTGASVGSIEDRASIESIRRVQSGGLSHVLASVTDIDFTNQTLKADSSIPAISNSSADITKFLNSSGGDSSTLLEISYDKLIIACGAVVNTFNTPGVSEHAFFLKDVTDAQLMRSHILSLFSKASLPGCPESKKKSLLHFAVVGGGPTGIEFLGELYDLIHNDLSYLYPKEIIDCVSMTVFDVAPKIMSTFHESLMRYTLKILEKRPNVTIRTSTSISKVTKEEIFIKSPKEEIVSYGLLLWATGVSPAQLVRSLNSPTKENKPAIDGKSGRILTDKYLRVIKERPSPEISFSNVWAIGDCAGPDLPPTAQVAKQKGEYVGKLLNRIYNNHDEIHPKEYPFVYKDRGYMAYIGEGKAVVALYLITRKLRLLKGRLANMTWSTAYLSMLTSWRNKILVPLYWKLTSWLGREISSVRQISDNK